jgi:uncharacterized membrane protein (GlpM family)
MELLWRFLIGGALVSVFALVGDVMRPKRFAGIFGAAPSIALATLALTVARDGRAFAAIEARSMVLTSGGFILYVYAVQRMLARGRWPTAPVSLAALVIWALAACASAALLAWLGA